MRRILVCFLLLPLGLAACSGHPNIKSAKDYSVPPAPPVRNPSYSPYTAYGEANATWTPASQLNSAAAANATAALNGQSDLLKNQVQQSRLSWTVAGAYYLKIAKLNASTLSLLNTTPVTTSPTYDSTGSEEE